MHPVYATLVAASAVAAKAIAHLDMGARQPASVTASITPTTASGAASTACAQVSAASASYLSANPSAKAAIVNASLAVDCLKSIPIVQDDALALLKSYRTYLEFQSDKEYIKNPPDGYPIPGYDLDAVLNGIQTTIEDGGYESEIDFQVDIYYALQRAFDGHLSWSGDILKGVFSFGLSSFPGLASVSVDGISDPQIYFVSDLVQLDKDSSLVVPYKVSASSPVTRLNGVAIADAIQQFALSTVSSQDPDARYNNVLFSIGRTGSLQGALGSFATPPEVDYYEFEFANATTMKLPVVATVQPDFTDVTNGQIAYERFAPFASQHSLDGVTNGSEPTASLSATGSASTTASATMMTPLETTSSTSTASPNIPFFPYPVIKDDANLIAGYYLNDTGYEDVAVLQITGFETEDPDLQHVFAQQFSDALSYFLSNATAHGKKKLIIDLQGNGGGLIDLGSDTFVQLFPNMAPDFKANMRRSLGMDVVISTASTMVDTTDLTNATAGDELAFNILPFDYQFDMTPDAKKIDSATALLDGIKFGGTNFTAFFQTNYSDPIASEVTGFGITQANPSTKPPFAPENMIVVTDGLCASTCTTFSEHLKSKAGVQYILVGGRPRHGPVQAVGGIKGSQVFGFDVVENMIEILANATDADLAKLNQSEWQHFTRLPMARTSAAASAYNVTAGEVSAMGGVNGRNSFRIGDNSNTPLQFVYEAADCRIWFTPEMLYNPVALWNRVADVAFTDRAGLKYNSKYCVAGSTGHPTSISGGWQKGTLGPQDQGKVERSDPVFQHAPWAEEDRSGWVDWSKVADAKSFGKRRGAYTGDKWLVKLLCSASNAAV